MNRDNEGLLREMVRLKEILERMPNAFHTISPNPMSGDNYVPANEYVRLQYPYPYLYLSSPFLKLPCELDGSDGQSSLLLYRRGARPPAVFSFLPICSWMPFWVAKSTTHSSEWKEFISERGSHRICGLSSPRLRTSIQFQTMS